MSALKLIILDRDGVINEDSLDYIKSPDEFIVLPGSAEAIAALTSAGFSVVVATNQSGIARGLYTDEQLTAIHAKMQAQVEAVGGLIERIEYCAHMPDSGCLCRKPKPGLLQRISKTYNKPLTDVPFVGDRISDLEAAEAAGAIPILIRSQMTDVTRLAEFPHVPIYHSLAEYVHHFLKG